MTHGSRQLRLFRRAIRDESSLEDAAAIAGMSIEEARIHFERDQADPPPPEAYELIGHNTPEEPAMAETDDTPAEDVAEELEETERDDTDLIELAAGTLRGDIRDSILSWFKAQQKPWSQLGEAEQRNFADAADRYAHELIGQVAKIIAAGERPCIVAILTEYKEKDGVEAKLKLPSKGEVVAQLHEACGREVLIVATGEEAFDGEGAPAEIDADSPEFANLGEEYREEPALTD